MIEFAQYGSLPYTDFKNSSRVATTAALPAATYDPIKRRFTAVMNGALPAIDGVTPEQDNRILVKNEGDTTRNGLFFVEQPGDPSTPWMLLRTPDADSSEKVTSGMVVPVSQGATNGARLFFLNTPDPIVLDATGLTFASNFGALVEVGTALMAQGTTTDATVVTLLTVTVPPNSCYTLFCRVAAVSSTGGQGAGFAFQGAARRAGGGATLIGNLAQMMAFSRDDPLWDATLDVSGNDLRVRVNGTVGATVSWRVRALLVEAP